MFYNPRNGKRYTEKAIESMYGGLEGLDLRTFGLYPLNAAIQNKQGAFYTYFDNGVEGNEADGFKISWGKTERPIEEIKGLLASMVAAKRYGVETGGIIVSGKKIITDRDSQYMISGAVNAVNLDPLRVIKFKTAEGFIELKNDAIFFLASEIANHVQACFSREADLVEAINLALTFAELKSIYDNDMNTGWPV